MTPQTRPHDRFARYAFLSSIVTVLAGFVVTLGWEMRWPVMRGDFRGTFVAPNSALLLMLFGTAHLIQARRRSNPRAGDVISALVLLISALIVTEHLSGRDLGIDRLYLSNRLSDWYVQFPVGRIAFPTSVAFVFAGLGLLMGRHRRFGVWADVCGSAVLAICYLSLIGYAYGVARFYGRVMALPTTLLLLPVGLTVLFSRAGNGLAKMVTGPDLGSVVLRRFTPFLLVVIPVLGLLRTLAERSGWSDSVATAMFVLSEVVFFLAILLHTSSLLNKADASRKQKQKELQDFFDNAVVGLHWVGPDGTILWANRAELQLLGYEAEEYIGKNIAEFHADEEVICDILKRLSSGEELHAYGARLRCKDGSFKHVQIHSSVLFEEDHFVHTRCFTYDVSAEVEAQARLAEQEAMIREKEKLAVTGRMAAALAHEINNPLEAVTNLVYLTAQDKDLSPESKNYLTMAAKELKRMAHVARTTLAFARGTSIPTRFSVPELCEGILAVIEPRLTSRHLRIEVQCDNVPDVIAVETEAHQVISNLVLNAIEAAPDGSTIKLSAHHCASQTICIAVEDNGRGISDADEKRVFEPFFTTKNMGTGLGLWVSQEIMTRNGGMLKLENPRNPTRFCAYFKAAEVAQTISA